MFALLRSQFSPREIINLSYTINSRGRAKTSKLQQNHNLDNTTEPYADPSSLLEASLITSTSINYDTRKDFLLLSIKPKYWDLIKSGAKRWEFRQFGSLPAAPFHTIVFYATSPVCRLVGVAEVRLHAANYVDELWADTNHEAGISACDFEDYYRGRTKGEAIRLGDVYEFEFPLSYYPPPQSWRYMPDDLLSVLDSSRLRRVFPSY